MMNHSQVEFGEQMEVVGSDIIISAFNGKDQLANIYGSSVGDIELHSETELSDSIEDVDDSVSSANSSSGSESSSSSTSSVEENDGCEEQIPDVYESAKIGNQEFQLPRGLCENASIFYEFFSLNTWNILPNEMKQQLKKHLPQFSNLKNEQEFNYEQAKTIQLFFNNQLKSFGRSPLQEIQENLEEGNYRPDVIEYKESIAKSKRRERRYHNCERLSQLAKELFISREKLLRAAYQSSPDDLKSMQKAQQRHISELHSDSKLYSVRARKRYHVELLKLSEKFKINAKELLSDDDDIGTFTRDVVKDDSKKQSSPEDNNQKNSSNSNTDKKCIYNTLFKRKTGLEDEESMKAFRQFMRPKLTSRNYRHYLLEHKRRKLSEPNLPEFETCDIRFRDVCNRAQIGGNLKKLFGTGKTPGRKPKANIPLSSEPPALVPIQPLRKYEPIFNNDDLNILLPNSSELPPLTKTLSPFSSSSFKNDPFFPNSSQLASSNAIHEDNEVFNILGEGVELQNDVDSYNNNDESIPSFVLEQNPELPQNVLQAAVGNEETPKKRPVKIDLSKIIDSEKIPKLEPISSRPRPVSGRPQAYLTKSQQMNILRKTSNTPVSNSPSNSYIANPELIQETHACFFALVRDFFCATQNHRMRFDDLKNKMDIWLRNPITALNEWYMLADNWSALLTSAVKFLAGEYSQLPEEYVPYIEHKTHINMYQWIGAGRDSDARLTELCSFWLQLNKDGVTEIANNNEEGLNVSFLQSRAAELEEAHSESGTTPPPPPPRCPTSWTVRPATPEEIVEFHRQERERFENPHKAYTYRMHGYESVVGPVKGIYSQILALTKARGHSIMVADRPNFVTILTLVRDATARLPNGEGTRADISELLKCSQYINLDAAENVLQSVVSGALDRMHTEQDPCVRYDAKRKIWIYLHRNRSIEEFEKMHHQNQIVIKQKKPIARRPKIKSTGSISNGTSNDAESMCTNIVSNSVSAAPMTLLTPVNNFTLPALVPANPIVLNKSTLINKQQQVQTPFSSPSTLSKCPPVPPLKYNIPSQIQQKSLLKITRQVEAKPITQINSISPTNQQKTVSRTPNTTNMVSLSSSPTVSHKQFNITLASAKSPIIVATANGLQTVRVANTSSGPTPIITPANAESQVLSATVGGKKVALNKPIIINQITQQTSPKGRGVQALKQQQNQQHQQTTITLPVDSNTKETKLRNVQTVYVDQSQIIPNSPVSGANLDNNHQQPTQQQLPQGKNFIRLIPAINTNGGQVKSIISAAQVNGTKQQVQLIGPRMVTNSALRTATQKSIGNISIVSNNTSGSPSATTPHLTTTGGAIVKMTPQAFAALQQKQSGQSTILVKPNPAAGGTQQRIVVGNTAIITPNQSSNMIVSSSPVSQTSTVVSSVSSPAKTVNAQNLIPQQQRTLIQGLKQQQQQPQQIHFKTVQVVPSNNSQSTLQQQALTQQQNHQNHQQQITSPQCQDTQLQPTIARLGSSQSITIVPQRSTVSSQATSVSGLVPQHQSMAPGVSKPMTVMVSQSQGGITRLIKASATNANQQQQQQVQQQNSNTGGQIISLESLIQKQGRTIRIAGSNTNIVKTSTSQPTNQIIQITGNNFVPQNTSTQQFTVVSQPRNIITLGSNQRLITTQANASSSTSVLSSSTLNTQAKEIPRVAGTMTTSRIVTGSSNPSMNSPRMLSKTTVVASGGNINLSQLQGKQVVFTTKQPASIKNVVSATATSQASQLQTTGVILGGQTVKIQGNTANIQQGNKSGLLSTSQASPQLQTLIMGNQILKVQQLSQISTSNQNRVLVSNSTVSPITTIANSNSSGTIMVNSSENVLNATQSRNLPKTIVLGSPGQTIRLQPANSCANQLTGNIKTIVASQQQKQPKIVHTSESITGSSAKGTTLVSAKNTIPASRVVFTVPGSNQIFLSSNFQGGPLNIKQLQNMKLVSINPTQQSNSSTTANLIKTEGNPHSNNSTNSNNNGNNSNGNSEIINISSSGS